MLASRTSLSSSELSLLSDELEDALRKLRESPSILAYRMSLSSMPVERVQPHICPFRPLDIQRIDPSKPKAVGE
jgi:hypothetical protein